MDSKNIKDGMESVIVRSPRGVILLQRVAANADCIRPNIYIHIPKEDPLGTKYWFWTESVDSVLWNVVFDHLLRDKEDLALFRGELQEYVR